MEALTAAHKHLPFDSLVEVRNHDTGRRVRVRINDRGPFVGRRIIDLSRAAAREIDMIGPGTARVTIKVLGRSRRNPTTSETASDGASGSPSAGSAAVPATYLVQTGSFRSRAQAEVHLERVGKVVPAARVERSDPWHRVVTGPLPRERADATADSLRQAGFEALLLSVDPGRS